LLWLWRTVLRLPMLQP